MALSVTYQHIVCNLRTFDNFCWVKILVRKTILYYIKKYPLAESQLVIWCIEFSRQTFKNFNDLKKVDGNASIVNNNGVDFTIKEKDFRLVISLNFLQAASYVIWFGTHKEYDKLTFKPLHSTQLF